MEVFVDTETTGLTRLSFANGRNYRQWPRLVQLAWILADEGGIQRQDCKIIKPNGFQIPLQSTQIHGISHAQAMSEGREIVSQLNILNEVLKCATTIVAHNLNFDLGILQSEALRNGVSISIPDRRYCTAQLGLRYWKKRRGYSQSGFPRLGDLYEDLFGFGFYPKHRALSDCTACYHIFRKLRTEMH